MTNAATLPNLLERLRAATGADILLDAELPVALGVWTPMRGFVRDDRPEYPWRWTKKQHIQWQPHVPYTASLDAALALVQAKLPGWAVTVTSYARTGLGKAVIWRNYDGRREYESNAPTAPLALLCALVTALIGEDGNG